MRRVYIEIFDDVTGQKVETEEPLFTNEDDIASQAYRTQMKFLELYGTDRKKQKAPL